MLTVDDVLFMASSVNGVVMIIGEPDTGKSYLAKELFRIAKLSGKDVSLVDLDVGQQSLAYPGTVAFTKNKKDGPFLFEKMRFVGTINPVLRIEELISATRALFTLCISSDLTIVDTSGLVAGESGKMLKTKKIRSLMPDLIIAIQRSEEIEHILRELPEFQIIRVRPSPTTVTKSREFRIKNRIDKLSSYFSQPCNLFFLKHRHVRLRPEGLVTNCPPGRIVGLNSKGETIALGILEGVDREGIFLLSPLPTDSITDVDEVLLGDRGLEFQPQTC